MTTANEDDLMPAGELAAMLLNSNFETMKDKLTAADLALYLAASVQVKFQRGKDFHIGTLLMCSQNDFHLEGVNEEWCPLGYCHVYGNHQPFWPILRRYSDMTAEEYLQCGKFEEIPAEFPRGAARTKYLLSIGIDLFGWIEAGLAIDKPKMSHEAPA